ncbi:MAG: protein kinase [Nannocystaceae bacterium]|nr:protein kinase [Nannocystaceae bacterium]
MEEADPKTDIYGTPVLKTPEPTAEVPIAEVDVLGLLGTQIHGGFVVEELISSDGLSMVYRAAAPDGTREAALKCFYGLRTLSPESLSTFRDRFRRITSLLGALSADQPSMTRVLGQGWMSVGDREIPCMLLEWIEGVSLQTVLDAERRDGSKQRSIAEVFALMHPTLRALSAAHAYGLTHRNLNPGNLFVDDANLVLGSTVRIMDYALARLEGEPFDDAITFLTPEYASPEQFMGYEHLVGPWTDVFAMALVIMEMMLGGRQVMPGADFESLRDACLDEERRPTPRSFGLDVSDAVEMVFLRAFEIDVHRRYNSGAHFMGALSRALESGDAVQVSAAGEIQHDASHYLTRNGKPMVVREKRDDEPTSLGGDTQVGAPVAPGSEPPLPAVITGETVIAPRPVRSGQTVLAPVPTFDDS